MNKETIPTWELLQKRITYQQLGQIKNKRILDFGSGNGVMASYLAKDNEVIAIEPNQNMFKDMLYQNSFIQIVGGLEELRKQKKESFDVIICHNVLEYAQCREEVVKEFYRLLKPAGSLSVVKQMVVLLNEFETAHQILDGQNGYAQDFGEIHYFDDQDICRWEKRFVLEKTLGIRTFWDLQQNQNVQTEEEWQENMIEIEERVSTISEFQAIAFFHHVFYRKEI